MSNVKLFDSPTAGRGLKATRPVEPGTTVLSSEPFAYVLDEKVKGSYCDYCFMYKKSVKACTGCKFMHYCDKNCQRDDWISHEPECDALKRVATGSDRRFLVLLGRILWKLKNLSPGDQPRYIASVMDLESDWDGLDREVKDDIHLSVNSDFKSYWGSESLPTQVPDLESVEKLCAIWSRNSFPIRDEDSEMEIGKAIYIDCSLINHSCVPNCVAVFDGRQLNIRAIQKLEEGEEVFVTYQDQLMATQDRQTALLRAYGFNCTCEACTSRKDDDGMLCDFDGKVLAIDSDKIKLVKKKSEELEEWYSEGKLEEIENLASEYVKAPVLSPKNVYMAGIWDVAMEACHVLEHFEKALEYGKLLLEIYNAYLFKLHPRAGMHRMKLGYFCLRLSEFKEAATILREALEILDVTHGCESIPAKKVRKYLLECVRTVRVHRMAE